jgi:DNA-binding SARP family transcriptional activator
MSRARAMVTGLAALVVLSALVIGLPVVLYRFGGSPLPGHVYTWHHISAILASRDDGALLLGVVRDLSWLAWLLFSTAVLAEAQAALRGRSAPRLWLGGLQGSAARLIALAALTFTAPSAITVGLAASASSVAPGHPITPPATGAGGHAAATAGQAEAGAGQAEGMRAVLVSAATRSITVRSGDCLWTIARHYLGAGDKYPEIASMNYGRSMGDGQVFTNPSLIEPGWRLLLPVTADVASQDPAGPGSVTTGMAHHPGHVSHDSHFRRRHVAASQARTAGGAAGEGAAAGGQLASPANYQTSASVSAPAGGDLTEAAIFAAGALAGAVLTSLMRLRRRQRQYRRRGRRIALPADPRVLAVEQRLYAAAPVSPPSTLQDALSCLESGITGAGQVLPDIVGLHVVPHMLEVLLAAPALDAPPLPYVISPGRQGMCWQLELPREEGSEDRSGRAPGEYGSGLLPGLFTAGTTEDGYLLLDLESLQVTGCDGAPELVDQVVTATATELATRQWSGWYDLILVGFDELEVLGRAEHCANLDEALSMLDARCQAVERRLADQPPADVRQLRLAAPDDEDWGLVILVSRAEPSPDQLTRMLELTEDGPGGFAALVAGDPETADGRMAPTVLQLAPDPQRPGAILANVIPLQIVVSPQVLADADYQAISTLFATAADTADVSRQQAPYEMYAAPPWIPQAATLTAEPASGYRPWAGPDLAECDDRSAEQAGDGYLAEGDGEQPGWHDASEFAWSGPGALASDAPGSWQPAQQTGPGSTALADGAAATPWVVRGQQAQAMAQPLSVRILGPLVITGAVDQLQPKQAELVLALALAAPGGLSNSALCSMLGADPDHPKPADAVRQIITRTRRRLGQASDGREYIMHAGNGIYLMHPDVSLDWTEFRNLIASSKAEEMRTALAMVRGEPFTGSYYWWIDIPLLESVRAEIVDAAQTLAEFELATGSARAASRAARAGLAAEVSAEQLWRLLMRAEHAAGNPGGVAEAWRHCLAAIEDVAPGGEPHSDTAELYRQLTATARQNAAVRG